MKKKKAIKLYESFTGYDFDKWLNVKIDSFKNLSFLGMGEALEYIAKKHSDRKEHIYRHVFDEKPIVATNGKQIIIIGNIKITEAGIEG